MIMGGQSGYLWTAMCAMGLRGMLGYGKGTRKDIGDRFGQGSAQYVHAKMHENC